MELKTNIGIFQESNGSFSATRVIFFVGMIWAMLFTSLMYFFGYDVSPTQVIAVFTALSGVFIALKLGQKPMEKQTNEPKQIDYENAKG